MKSLHKIIYQASYPIFKNIAFGMDAEDAHELTIKSMKLVAPLLLNGKDEKKLHLSAMGMEFKGPIGLAAGLDKNAEIVSFMSHLPFGFIEIGTVTPKPQDGNSRPRLFRYPEEESLRNRMGFNNKGSEIVLENLKKQNRRGKIIGVNLGKNKITPNTEAAEDYRILYKKFAPHSDYLVINVSSPNTPGLRDLLKDRELRDICEAVSREREVFKKPLLIKVSPDMEESALTSVVGLIREYSFDGIIATNTTIMPDRGEGGISGKLLTNKARLSREIILKEIRNTKSEIELIGVGGFTNFSDLMEFWEKGGRLAQIYSAFIFQGPGFLYQLHEQLITEFKKRGVQNFDEFLYLVSKK